MKERGSMKKNRKTTKTHEFSIQGLSKQKSFLRGSLMTSRVFMSTFFWLLLLWRQKYFFDRQNVSEKTLTQIQEQKLLQQVYDRCVLLLLLLLFVLLRLKRRPASGQPEGRGSLSLFRRPSRSRSDFYRQRQSSPRVAIFWVNWKKLGNAHSQQQQREDAMCRCVRQLTTGVVTTIWNENEELENVVMVRSTRKSIHDLSGHSLSLSVVFWNAEKVLTRLFLNKKFLRFFPLNFFVLDEDDEDDEDFWASSFTSKKSSN